MSRFAEKVVVITGAGGGIGRAAAVLFAGEGASIVAVDRDASSLADTVTAISESGGQIHAVAGDVTSSADVQAYVQAAVDTFGGVDILFNNAGIEGVVTSLESYPEEDFDRVIAVNVKGVWLGMKYVADAMRQRGGGVIINTASVAGLRGTPGLIAYGASKHAVVGMTKTAAAELAPAGIRVNAVCPAPIETRMMRSIESGAAPDDPEAFKKQATERIPLGRYGEPEEVAALVAFLASDDAAFITGGIYPIDGGSGAVS
ncbi:MAG: NAD(P)-dependent dehydrogenase (short-subunit alcohol dehydrogenase family) [Acidimicrobiales bacterium]|jgi:3alpha(or 20beta)-hydroxysteroid dehydrogenase